MDSAQDSRTLKLGALISDYKIEGVLGQGAFGITYLATDTSLNVRVAIKEYFPREFSVRDTGSTVRPSGSKDDRDFFEWGRDRFLSEARILARLDHPNIVAVRRLLEANRTAYLVMDYCEGRPLDRIIDSDGPLTPDAVDKLVWPLVDALGHIHRAGLIHRDVKPANIFIRADGSPVLLDFGAARNDISQHSRSVTSLATAGYAPLEQYDTKGNQGPWSDIYGFSATLYRALTGDRPPDAAGRVLGDTIVPIAQRLSGKFNAHLLAAIDQGLAVLPSDRPQSVSEWRALLEGSSKTAKPVRTSPKLSTAENVERPVRPGEAEPNKADKRPVFLIASIATALLLGIVYFYGYRDDSAPGQSGEEKISPVVVPVRPPEPVAGSDNTSKASSPDDASKTTPKSNSEVATPKRVSECPKGAPIEQWSDCSGVYVNGDGAKYTGFFKGGRLEGQGRLEHEGDVYVGGFKSGRYHGTGTYTWKNGGSYTGAYENGLRNGHGVKKWASGSRYEGGFKQGLLHGRGKYEWPNGDVFEGAYVDGKREGPGRYTFKNGEIRENSYVADSPMNPTTIRFPDGTRYVGDIDFKASVYEGKGTMTFANGAKFIGNYRNGKRDGLGTEYDSRGVITRSGMWSEGKFVSNENPQVTSSQPQSSGLPAYATPSAVIPARQQDAANMAACNRWLSDSRFELPKTMDAVTTLVDFSCVQTARGVVVVFKYNFDGLIRWNEGSAATQKAIKAGIVKTACANDVLLALFDKLSFEHHYYDKNSKLGYVVPIVRSDCD